MLALPRFCRLEIAENKSENFSGLVPPQAILLPALSQFPRKTTGVPCLPFFSIGQGKSIERC
jgi:hypothetical protein